MKTVTQKIPFFVNEDNMEYLLSGCVIDNLDIRNNKLFSEGCNIYKARISRGVSEYPDIRDEIIGKSVRFIGGSDGQDYLEVELYDTLYFSKLNRPVIKVNGYCTMEEDGKIHITKITRLTLAEGGTNNRSYLNEI